MYLKSSHFEGFKSYGPTALYIYWIKSDNIKTASLEQVERGIAVSYKYYDLTARSAKLPNHK